MAQRFASVSRADWTQRFAAGDVLLANGSPASADSPLHSGQTLYYYRTVAEEKPIPFAAHVLWQDEHLVVADKPHFLPVVPSGQYLRETLLVRLKEQLQLPHLSPLHRIDRDTAGVVVFGVRAQDRGAYQQLFRQRSVDKVYECIAPYRAALAPALAQGLERSSRIEPSPAHFMQQCEVDAPPHQHNAHTTIRLLAHQGQWAHYQLHPRTGQRHQLRVHMAALGLPIRYDGIYPTLTPEGSSNYAEPLQLLASSIAFADPITGQHRFFASQRSLLAL
ncbi:pseudouridine synthase [Curvibacter sp. CHRR-16]|nr:pseudouridine synthase [Curvibacter sp. CHRR-16]